MKQIKNAVFLKSDVDCSSYKGFGLPEILLVGRSNVGKSSLVNMLSNNSKLAKVSSTQGKTRLINYFMFNKEFVLVDVPGYGYAEVSKLEQQRWNKMLESYFSCSKNIKGAILLVDARLIPTKQDLQMFNYLITGNIPVTIVATKYDKLKKSERIKNISDIALAFKVGVENIYIVSSETAFGKDNLVQRIYQFVGE